MEQSVNTYTKEEKAEAFEYVNNIFLHLKGAEKSRLKRAMTNSWKQNKTIGCLELFMKLYTSYDVYDKDNEWFKKYVKEGEETPEDYNTKKIALAKHRRIVGRREEDNDELQHQLDNVMEQKGLMTREDYDEGITNLKKSHKRDIEVMEDNCMKKVNQISVESEKKDFTIRILEDKVKYLEDALKQYETKD